MTGSSAFGEEIERLSALADPVRRRLYDFVADQGRPVGRDEAAAGVGVARHTAKFHLDKLADEGMLEVEFRRLTERTGPGAGRPAKLYRRSDRELAVSVPARHYELAGAVLADAMEAAGAGIPAADALVAAARRAGQGLAEACHDQADQGSGGAVDVARLGEVLGAWGFEPYPEAGGLALRNCPFHALAAEHPELVCGMNRELLDALVRGLGVLGATARLEPADGRCCVTIAVAAAD